jgi:hypothetical protein
VAALESGDDLAREIVRHFDVALYDEGDHVCVVRRSSSPEADLARLLAEHIVLDRVGRRIDLMDTWRAVRDGRDDVDQRLRSVLDELVRPGVGSRDVPRSRDHLEGFIAEHLWYAVTRGSEDDEPLRHVWGPSFDVTDPGGDGLAIHVDSAQELFFRLWETKKYTGPGDITATGLRAIRQLDREATRYLARFKGLGEEMGEADLADFHSVLVDLWLAKDDQAAIGISLASSSSAVNRSCFARMTRRFPHMDAPHQLRGQANGTDDFPAFVDDVVDEIWNGL